MPTTTKKPKVPAKIKQIIETFERWEADYKKSEQVFLGRMKSDPVHAFEWAEATISLAVRARAGKHWIDSIYGRLEDEPTFFDDPDNVQKSIDLIKDVATREALGHARHPKRSTSMLGNYIHGQEGTAHVEVLEALRYI